MKFTAAITAITIVLFSFTSTEAKGDANLPAQVAERHEDVLKILDRIEAALGEDVTREQFLLLHPVIDLLICRPNGFPCGFDHTCCGYCEGIICLEKKKNGHGCSWDSECKSGRCSNYPGLDFQDVYIYSGDCY
jgi:hypothetical protein